MSEKLARLLEAFDIRRFVKFGLIGVLNTLVDFGVFFLMDRYVIRDGPTLCLFGLTVATGSYISNFIAYAAANIHSFLWNRFWTFQKREPITRREVGRYLLTSVGYLTISSVSLGIFMAVLSLPVFSAIPADWVPMMAKFPTACVTIFYNYLMNKFWVFR